MIEKLFILVVAIKLEAPFTYYLLFFLDLNFVVEDIRMLPCVSCGGFAEKLLDIVMWFSSGGTKSVLHNDGSDNLNCLFRGSKELVMIDKVKIAFFIKL